MNNHNQKQQLKRTASTMPNYHTQTAFSHFGKPRRNQKRLNSTIRFNPSQQIHRNKFNPISEKHINWQKWKTNSFPIVWDGFTGMLKKKADHAHKKNERQQRVPDTQIKLRHKIREVMKLQSDIERARQNNRLIEVIDDYHQAKINGFFDHLEAYLDQHP